MAFRHEYLLREDGTFYYNDPMREFLRERYIEASLEDPDAQFLERAILQADRERAALHFQSLAKKTEVLDRRRQQMNGSGMPRPVLVTKPPTFNSLGEMSEMLRKEFDKVRTQKADVLSEETLLFLDELHTFMLVHGASHDENAVAQSLLMGLMQMPSSSASPAGPPSHPKKKK